MRVNDYVGQVIVVASASNPDEAHSAWVRREQGEIVYYVLCKHPGSDWRPAHGQIHDCTACKRIGKQIAEGMR